MSDAGHPAFDPNGKYLYFTASTRQRPLTRWHRPFLARPRHNQRRLRGRAAQGRSLAHAARKRRRKDKDEKKKDEPKADTAKDEKKDDEERQRQERRQRRRQMRKDKDDKKDDKDKEDDKDKPVKVTSISTASAIASSSLPIPARNYGGIASRERPACFISRRLTRTAAPPRRRRPRIRALWRFTSEKRQTEDVLNDVDGFIRLLRWRKAPLRQERSLVHRRQRRSQARRPMLPRQAPQHWAAC